MYDLYARRRRHHVPSDLDETTCSSTPGCAALRCGTCSAAGETVYRSCYRSDVSPPPCIDPSCPPPVACSGLEETTCKMFSDCQAQYCPDCMGGQTFVGCGAPGSSGPGCAECLSAPVSLSPGTPLPDETTCDALSDYLSLGIRPATAPRLAMSPRSSPTCAEEERLTPATRTNDYEHGTDLRDRPALHLAKRRPSSSPYTTELLRRVRAADRVR